MQRSGLNAVIARMNLPARAGGHLLRVLANGSVRGLFEVLTDGSREAADEGVARHALAAVADGVVVDHLAQGVRPARARARVTTLLVYACHYDRAIRIDYTLGPTIRWVAEISSQTLTHGPVPDGAALGVGAARAGVARVHGAGRRDYNMQMRVRQGAISDGI